MGSPIPDNGMSLALLASIRNCTLIIFFIAIIVHGSDSDEAPATQEDRAPSPANILSSAPSFVFTDPLAEFL